MTLTRTDKQFIATLAAIFLAGAMALWLEHGYGRRRGIATVLEFNRVPADQAEFPAIFSPTGKFWTTTTMRWGIPERFRARVLLGEEALWITVPLEFVGQLESGKLLLTYKRKRGGEVKIYKIGRVGAENAPP